MGKLVADKSDQENRVSSPNSSYSKRLDRITKNLKNEDGLNLNFKVYEVSDVNAFALPDGSIRVFSALMDIMDDDELLFIVGHEIGHVKNKDSFNRLRTAYRVSAARKAAGAGHRVAASITDSQLGDLAEKFIHAQYSQSQESSADEYGALLMKKYNRPVAAGASGLRKLGGGGGGAFSSHPDAMARADRIEKMK